MADQQPPTYINVVRDEAGIKPPDYEECPPSPTYHNLNDSTPNSSTFASRIAEERNPFEPPFNRPVCKFDPTDFPFEVLHGRMTSFEYERFITSLNRVLFTEFPLQMIKTRALGFSCLMGFAAFFLIKLINSVLLYIPFDGAIFLFLYLALVSGAYSFAIWIQIEREWTRRQNHAKAHLLLTTSIGWNLKRSKLQTIDRGERRYWILEITTQV